MSVGVTLRTLCLLLLLCQPSVLSVWWARGSPVLMDPNHICKKSRRIGGKQNEICSNEPKVIEEVAVGVDAALKECQYQFRNRRWNCHTEKNGIYKVLKLDTKEAAFVNAIISAGVMYSITEACSKGELLQCGCDPRTPREKPDDTWQWGGCNDDIRYSYRKSKHFLDVKKKKRMDASLRLQLHNNEVGRLIIRDNMRKVCKCHGLSGSCSLQTCWIKMPKFMEVGEMLKKKFDSSHLVTLSNDNRKFNFLSDNNRSGQLRPIRVRRDLIYTTQSPDYCKADSKKGSLGTRKRSCDPESSGTGGCELLCCGRGYKTHNVKVTENCNCKFQWCCEVTCDICVVMKTRYTCK